MRSHANWLYGTPEKRSMICAPRMYICIVEHLEPEAKSRGLYAYLVVVVPLPPQPMGCLQVSDALHDVQNRICVAPSEVMSVRE